MLWEIIITIAIIAVLLSLAKHVFKGLLKLFMFFVMAIIAVIGMNAFFVYRDVVDLRENFADSAKKVVLMENGQALTGLVLGRETRILPQEELIKISDSLKAGDIKSALGGSYKLIAFDIKAISALEDKIDMEGKSITKEEALATLRMGNDNEKAATFESLLRNNIFSSNSVFFFSQLKEGNIQVYQETALFKAAKIMPLSAINTLTKNVFRATKEQAGNIIGEIK